MASSSLWYFPFPNKQKSCLIKEVFQVDSLQFFSVYIIWLRKSFLLAHIQIIFNNFPSEKHVITMINLNL